MAEATSSTGTPSSGSATPSSGSATPSSSDSIRGSESKNIMQVEFVSPEELLYSGEADTVIARTRGGGDIAFLFGHEPFIGSLITSEVKVHEAGSDSKVRSFVVRGGFVSVTGSKVTVISDAALPAEEIDITQVKADLAEAESGLEKDPEDIYLLADQKWAQVQLAAVNADEA